MAAETLDGKARLAQLHGIFHMDEQVPFCFEWDWLAPSGLSTKDFIAPSGFEFRTGKQFRMGKKLHAALHACTTMNENEVQCSAASVKILVHGTRSAFFAATCARMKLVLLSC